MRSRFTIISSLLAILGGFHPSVAAPAEDVARIVARSLAYSSATERRYSISDDWKALSGETVVCARLDIPNGAGDWTATSDYSMFFLSKGAVVNMTKDNTLFGCPNRSYSPLQPASR